MLYAETFTILSKALYLRHTVDSRNAHRRMSQTPKQLSVRTVKK